MGLFTKTPPGNPHVASGDVTRTIQIRVQTVPTDTALKEAPVPGGSSAVTPVTLPARVVGPDIDHPNTLPGSLVLQEALQLPKGPPVHPPIIPCGLPDASEILQHQYVAFRQSLKDSLGYCVVCPGHEPFPRAACPFELAFGGPCAFSLELSHLVFPPEPLLFGTSEEAGVAGHRQRVDTKINPHDFAIGMFVGVGVDFLGEGETKQEPTLVVFDEGAFAQLPIEVFFENLGDDNLEFHSSLEGGQRKNCPALGYGGAAGKVVPDGEFFGDFGFGPSTLDHFHCLGDGVNHQLGLEAKAFLDFVVAASLELSLVFDLVLPGDVYTELDHLVVHPHGVVQDWGSIDEFDFCGGNDFHGTFFIVSKLFKHPLPQLFPTLKDRGFLEAKP